MPVSKLGGLVVEAQQVARVMVACCRGCEHAELFVDGAAEIPSDAPGVTALDKPGPYR